MINLLKKTITQDIDPDIKLIFHVELSDVSASSDAISFNLSDHADRAYMILKHKPMKNIEMLQDLILDIIFSPVETCINSQSISFGSGAISKNNF